jgi:PTH1 family peptidyl-tRNA hydrolase
VAIKLIVGLGNPGKDYQGHRHNVGFWFCDALAHLYTGTFKKESKFFGAVAQINIASMSVWLLKLNPISDLLGACRTKSATLDLSPGWPIPILKR